MRTITVLSIFLMAGCSTIQESTLRSITPGLLVPATFQEEAAVVYDEVFLLAFERGYQISYASREEMMLEIDLPTKNAQIFGTDWVHRVAVLVRDRDGHSILHTRYHSYDPEDGNLRVVDSDHTVAAAFRTALLQRLTPTAQP